MDLSNFKQFAETNEAYSHNPWIIRDQEQVSVNSNKSLKISANHHNGYWIWTYEGAGNKKGTFICIDWYLLLVPDGPGIMGMGFNYLISKLFEI